MTILHLLRMLADLGFYYALAGFVAAFFGGSGALAAAVLQAVCFALASTAAERKPLRLVLLLPMALGWLLYRGSPADCILILPPALYILSLVWNGDFTLNQDRQQTLFGLFWKLLIAAIPVGLLLGGSAQLRTITLPYGILMLACSVVLMRALRHDSQVYRQRSWQLMNLSIVAVVLAVTAFFSSDLFLNGFRTAAKAVYNTLFLPVLTLLVELIVLLMQALGKLAQVLNLRMPTMDRDIQLNMEGLRPDLSDVIIEDTPNETARTVFIALAVVAAVVVLVLLFRWMSKKRYSNPIVNTVHATHDEHAQSAAKTERDPSAVRSVRIQYRKFLKLCATYGVQPGNAATSRDIDAQARQYAALQQISGPIREIYIRARYGGQADKASVQQMKKLYAEGKKNIRQS